MIRRPPTIDVLPDGSVHVPPGPLRLPVSTKVVIGAVLVAVVGAAFAVAALAIWVVSMILPVVIIAAGIAWAGLRYRRWQSLRGQRDGHDVLRSRQPGGFGQ